MRLKIRTGVRLGVIAASLAMAAAVSQPAFADAPGSIDNIGSHLCLQPVPNQFQGPKDNGVRIAQMRCIITPQDPNYLAQQWQAVTLGKSGGSYYYYLINQNSGKCMDVTDANTADHAPIQQWDCNGGGSEMWFMNVYAFGRYQYVNYRTSKCLDIPGASTSPTYIQQYHCTSSNVAQAYAKAPVL